MFCMNNSGKLHLSKKVFIILTGSVLLVALIGWVVLVSGLLKKDKKPDGEEKSKNGTFTPKEPKYEIPEVPDGYVMVFRQTSRYEVADNGVRTLRAEMEYDEYGREISETGYDIEGAFSHREVYEYDERGNVIKRTEYDESGFVLYVWEAVYNEQGVMIERRDNALRDYFDDNGNLLYEKYILYSGEEGIDAEYRYSDDGKLIEVYRHDSEYREIYTYDDLGRPLATRYYSDGALEKEDIYVSPNLRETYDYTEPVGRYLRCRDELDDEGRIIHEVIYETNGAESIDRVNEYDADGNIIKSIRYENGEFDYWYEYEYADKTAFFGTYLRPTKATSKKEDGTIDYYRETEWLPGFGRIREQQFNGDGTRKESDSDYFGTGWWGYCCKKDSYGNPICNVSCVGDREVVMEEFKFTPMVSPEEYLTDYDREVTRRNGS